MSIRRTPLTFLLTSSLLCGAVASQADDLLMYGPSLAVWLEDNGFPDRGAHPDHHPNDPASGGDSGSRGGPALVPFVDDESHFLTDAGHTVTIVDEAQWRAMTTAEFAAFDAIVIGDAGCDFDEGELLAPLTETRSVWSPAVTGHLFVHTFDPIYHFNQNSPARGGGATPEQFQAMIDLVVGGVEFAASGGSTGLFYGNGCRDFGFDERAPVSFISLLTSWDLSFDQRGDAVEVVDADHPAMEFLTDEALSNWSNSYHALIHVPASQMDVLAVDPGSDSLPGGPIIAATLEVLGDQIVFVDGFESAGVDAWSTAVP